jgi:hypothetical protein
MSHPKSKILFIAGIGRSGSTLLSRMLAQIDGFQAVGELHHLWQTRAPLLASDELCGCGASYADCRFWPAMIDTALGSVDRERLDKLAQLKRRTDRVRYIPWMRSPVQPATYARRLQEYRPIVRSLYAAIDSTSQPRVIVDATKDPSSLYLLSTLPELEVTVLHLVRDPRGVAFSWAKRMRRPEIRDQQVYMPRQSGLRNATYWSYSNFLAGRSRRLHQNYILLRYEDFIHRPAEALRKICNLLGEDRADLSFFTDHRVSLDRPNHILKGNPSRFDAGPLDLRADEEWRSAMPSTQKLAVNLVAAPLLLRYGYLGHGSTDHASS